MSNLLRSLVVALLLSPALAGCMKPAEQAPDEPVVATVNGAPLYLSEFRTELQRLELEGADGLPISAGDNVQRQTLLGNMVDRKLLLRQAEAHHVVVGMDEVNALYQRTRHGWREKEEAGDCEECIFDEALRKKQLTLGEMKRMLREGLMIRKYLRDHVYARVAVTDEEIDAYLEANPEELSSPQRVRALQILVKTEDEAKQVLREVQRGLAFEDAAMKYSLSPEGRNGGDLGYFSRGEMPAVFDEACFNLRPGSLSGVVSSDYGFHIFKVVDREEGGVRPMETVREEVEQRLRAQKENEAQAAELQELREAAEIVIHEKVLAQLR